MNPVVSTTEGALSGVPCESDDVVSFRGIPYAKPPVGALRWRPPQRPESWQGTRRADTFGPIGPQVQSSAIRSLSLPMDEDCLYLNVWTRALGDGEKLPVLVWIYGGGFHEGTAADPAFDGENMAREGTVVVNFNYRLGALGFLSTPELSAESPYDSSGNYGLLDCIRALEWVQENIASFGGDPERVTIAGQSAGAGTCNFLAMSPLAKGLFHAVIAQSHARYSRDTELRYLSTSYAKLRHAESLGTRHLRDVVDTASTSPDELRALDWRRFVPSEPPADVAIDTGSSARPPLFRPVVDHWVLPLGYDATYLTGMQNPVRYIAGNNLDEAGAVADGDVAAKRARATQGNWHPGMPPSHVTLEDFRSSAREKFEHLADEFLGLYPASNDDEAASASSAAARDNSRVSTYLWGKDWARHCDQTVYTYFWTHRPPSPGGGPRRASHASEIPYVLGNVRAGQQGWTEADQEVADVMSGYWRRFIAKGDPNGNGAPLWKPFDPAAATVMEVGNNFGQIAVASSDRLHFWRRFFDTQTPW